MPLANSSLTRLRYAQELTFGSVTGATARRQIRSLGSSFKYDISFTDSKEIRPDRQLPDHIPVGASSGGSVNFELSYREYDDLIAAALQSAPVRFNTTGTSPTLTTPTFTTSTLTQTAGTSFATIARGQWVKIQGITGALLANNGVYQVSLTVAPTATVITFEGTPFTAGSATGTVTISTSRIVNGSTQRSFAFEPEYTDQALFQTFRGQVLSKMSLSAQSKSILTGSFEFTGTDQMALSGTSNLPGTDDVLFPSTFDVLNTSSNFAAILEGGAPLTSTFVKSITLDTDNGVAGQDAVANLAPIGMRSNRFQVSGKMSVYFQTAALFNKFINNTTSSVAFRVQDAAGNGYVFTIPAVEYTAGGLSVGSLDQDIMIDLDFKAEIDPLSGRMILVDYFGV